MYVIPKVLIALYICAFIFFAVLSWRQYGNDKGE
jgi:hypothetical protein